MHKQYKYTLKDSRQGVNLNTTELIELSHLICPLIKRRLSKKKLKKRKEPENYTGRNYTDYLEYKIKNPNIVTTEMDTVYNN